MPIGDPELAGLFAGTVIDRADPERLGRVRVSVAGVVEESAWALPKGGGAELWGRVSVPPTGATVYVQFLSNDIESPVYEPGWYGKPIGEDNAQYSEMFPEHVDPDVHVWGAGPFRLVVDLRDPAVTGVPRSARWKLVKEVGGAEQDIVWIEINEDNSAQVHADNSLQIDVGGILDLLGTAGVQVQGRKVMRGSSRPIA